MIRLESRSRFTQADFEFILSFLADNCGERKSLGSLLVDSETLDLILDHEKLFQALLEIPEFVRVSPHFYFYVMVRRALLRAGFRSRELADYVAALLAEFSTAQRMRHPLNDEPYDYLVDLLRAIQEADDSTRFLLSLHLGNYSLFLAGVFLNYIRGRERRRAAPGLDYYEALGSSHFRMASDHRLAERYEIAPVLATLSDEFQSARRVLNGISDRFFCWSEGTIG